MNPSSRDSDRTPHPSARGWSISIRRCMAESIFPSTNSLKILGKFLGASWTEPDASGLQSIVWRHRWETGGEAQYKKKLISYNAEDCQALRILTEELAGLRTDADSRLNVDYVDQPKRNAPIWEVSCMLPSSTYFSMRALITGTGAGFGRVRMHRNGRDQER